MGKFTIFKGVDNQYYFNLKASNGEKILQSEGYSQKQSCKDGISSVKVNAPYDRNYERKNSSNWQYYFILKASNGEPLGKSETYLTVQSRENGIEAVKREAPTAPTEDNT